MTTLSEPVVSQHAFGQEVETATPALRQVLTDVTGQLRDSRIEVRQINVSHLPTMPGRGPNILGGRIFTSFVCATFSDCFGTLGGAMSFICIRFDIGGSLRSCVDANEVSLHFVSISFLRS